MKYFILVLLACAVALGVAFTSKTQGYGVGDEVENFTLKNIDGKMVALNDYNDQKGVVVVFTCNHCPYAVAVEDELVMLDKKYSKKGFPFVAVNPNDAEKVPTDSYANMQVRAKEKGFTFPYLYDETQAIAERFGALKTPHTFVLENKGGKFYVRYIGAIDNGGLKANKSSEEYLANALDELIAGKKVSKPETKAVGCGIKWAAGHGPEGHTH